MSTASKRQPAYLTIADDLRCRIAEQKLKPGERFPTERELVEEFKVARMTVRHALDVLQIEGLIDRKRGRTGGTFVRAVPPTLDLTNSLSLIEQLVERGHLIDIEVISCEKVPVSTELSDTLGIKDESMVWDLKRVVTADDVAVLSSSMKVPVQLVSDFNEFKLDEPVFPELEERGLVPVYTSQTLCAANARKEEQLHLNVSRSHPMLRLSRVLKMEDGTSLCQVDETLRSDAACVEVRLGEDPTKSDSPER